MATDSTNPSRNNVGAATGAACLAGLLWVASGFSSGYVDVALRALSVSSVLYSLVRFSGKKTPVDSTLDHSVSKLLENSSSVVGKGVEKVTGAYKKLSSSPDPAPAPAPALHAPSSAAMYAGGMAMMVDSEDHSTYQKLFASVEENLRECGLIDKRPVYLTFHFSTGKGFYRLADGTGVVHEFDILHPNILDPEYAKLSPAEQKEKAVQLEQAIGNLQSHCKKMVTGIGKKTMAQEIAGELQKEGKRKPDGKEFTAEDIVVNVDMGTYSIQGEPDKAPIPLSDVNLGRLREIRQIVEEQEQCIDKFVSQEDPEARRHLMGRVGNVRSVAQSQLQATKRWNAYLPSSTLTADVGGVSQSVVQQEADATLKDSEQELREIRAGYRIDVLEGIHLLVTDVEEMMIHVLDQMIEETRTQLREAYEAADESTRKLGFQAYVKNQGAKLSLQKFDEKFRTALNDLGLKQGRLDPYKEDFQKDIESYVQKINASIGAKTTVLESAQTTLTEIRAGIKRSEVLEKIFNITNQGSSKVICGIIDDTLQAEPEGSISWEEKMLNAEARRIASLDKKNDPDPLDAEAAKRHMTSVKTLEIPQIQGYVEEIYSQISRGEKSVKACVREEIKKIQQIQSNGELLRDSLRQEARKDIERRIQECIEEQDHLQERIQKGGLSPREQANATKLLKEKQQWLKKALDYQIVADVFLDNPMNDWVCRNYRHRIIVGTHSSSWNVFGKISSTAMEVAPKKEQMDELKCCFQDAKTSLLSSSFQGLFSSFFRSGPLPSKQEKMQAIVNSFTLLVPEGCEAEFEQFVLEQGKIDQACYTLPHGWKELRTMARERAKERSLRDPTPMENDVLNMDPTLTASLQAGFAPVQEPLEEESSGNNGSKTVSSIDEAQAKRIQSRRTFGATRTSQSSATKRRRVPPAVSMADID